MTRWPIAQAHDLVENGDRQVPGRQGKQRAAGLDVDGGTGHHQLADLGRKPRGVDQGHDSALAQPHQIDRRADLVDRDVELGQVVVDGEQAHVARGRAPVGDEDPRAAVAGERLHKAVAGGKVGEGGTVQGEGGANEGRHAGRRRREVAKLHGRQVEPHAIRRRPGRLGRTAGRGIGRRHQLREAAGLRRRHFASRTQRPQEKIKAGYVRLLVG
jgi:hypothetical protein